MNLIGDVYISRFKRRILVSCLSTIIGLPCMAVCLLGLFGVVFPALESADNNSTTIIIAALLVAVLIFLIGIPIIIVLIMNARQARSLDAIFTPLGLSGSSYNISGRQYQGQYRGRNLHVYFYRGPSIQFHLNTTIPTRMQIYAKNSIPASIANTFGKPALQMNDPLLQNLSIYAADEAWTQDLFSLDDVIKAVQQLITFGAEWAVFRNIELQPGEISLNFHRSRSWFNDPITEIEVQTWLQTLEILARNAESQPAPSVTTAASPITNQTRQSMNKFVVWMVVIIIVGIPLCAIATGIAAYLFAILSR